MEELSQDEERCQKVNTVVYSTILKSVVAARQPKSIFAVHAEMQ